MRTSFLWFPLCCVLLVFGRVAETHAASLLAGAAKVDITRDEAGPVEGRLHARALVIKNQNVTAVIVTLDVVAIGEIGSVSDDFLANVRRRIEQKLNIPAANVLVN